VPVRAMTDPISKAPGHPPSLNQAFARVSRAEEHLAELVRHTAVRGREQVNMVLVQPNPKDPNKVIVSPMKLPFDFSFSILVGEICYNLRSALDYMVYELAVLDSGITVEGTQFPIEDKKKGFEWWIKRGRLNGLNAAHIAAIAALQPYRGCHWTAILKNLSNPDKHRSLVPTQATHEITIHVVDREHLEDLRDMPGAIRSAVTSAGTEVYVKAALTTAIELTDGTPVIETLEEIKSEIARLLQTFKPDFESVGDAHSASPP
jgi:hypothetical protein